MLRIYFNRQRDYPLVWSIDTGTQADEIHVSEVASFVPMVTVFTKERPNPDSPTAWLEVRVPHHLHFFGSKVVVQQVP